MEKENLIINMQSKVQDILVDISWGQLDKKYFGIPVAKFYAKMNGDVAEEGQQGFTTEEVQQFKGALCDLADRIRKVADEL